MDLNLTLINSAWWNWFRSLVIQIGYFRRDLSFIIYCFLVAVLFILYRLVKKTKVDPVKLAVLIGAVAFFSYPFLSHDFFNYIFDARIFTFYHKNPYLFKALDFPGDPYLRFMHWTHRTYPYGPVFLPLTFIPSFLSFGKFVLNYFFFKGLFVFFYWLGVYVLNKISRKQAIVLATHPLIIVEGLISSHNDIIGLSIALVGAYWLFRNRNIPARVAFMLSAGIKYITLPFLILTKNKRSGYLSLLGLVMILGYLTFRSEIQPWYFISLFVFLPFYPGLIEKADIFLSGLLFSYYPYIFLGGWDSPIKVTIKHRIILVFFVVNLIFLAVRSFYPALFLKRSTNSR